jgi:DNA repair protein RecO (recombination protein O)
VPNTSIGLYRAQGIVLRGIKLGESDRIVTVFTQSQGRLRGVAKGIRKPKSRFGGRLDAFTHVDLQLYRGRGDLDVITQAEIIDRPRRVRDDYPAFCAASAMADVVDRTTPEREGNVRVFVLLKSALRALEAGAADPSLMAYAFLAKLSSVSGHHPTLSLCVDCGSQSRVAFSMDRGGAVCEGCVERADPKTETSVLDAWSTLLSEEWDGLRLRSFTNGARRSLGGLLVGFVQWHTEARLRAFALLPSSVAVSPSAS